MKRLFGFLGLLAGWIFFCFSVASSDSMPALVREIDSIGPATTSIALYASTSSAVTISAPTDVGVRNCLTNLVVSPSKTTTPANYTINMLDGGTTTYTINASTNATISLTWPETYPWCGSPKTQAIISGTALTTNPSSVSVTVSYQGFTKP